MFNKIYVFLKKNIKEIIIFLGIILVFLIPLPYFIESPGGLESLKNRIKIENGHEINGDISLVYVAERNGTLPNILASFIIKDWDILKKDEIVADNETLEDEKIRGRIGLEQSFNNALVYASLEAGNYIDIYGTKVYVTYIFKDAKTNLKVGDQIVSINEISIYDKSDIANVIEASDKLEIKVLNNGKEYTRTATVIELNGEKKIGITVSVIYDYKLENEISYKTKSIETGSSGGFANTLYIYASLIDEDIIKGKNIIATGTIDAEGNVGEIGGIKYKIKTAVKNKADLFLIPEGNCSEANKVKEENKYDLNLVCVSDFGEAIRYLINN